MDRWDMLIVAGAGYVAVMTLARLMVARRNELVDHVRQQIEQQSSQHQANPSGKSEAARNESDRGAA